VQEVLCTVKSESYTVGRRSRQTLLSSYNLGTANSVTSARNNNNNIHRCSSQLKIRICQFVYCYSFRGAGYKQQRQFLFNYTEEQLSFNSYSKNIKNNNDINIYKGAQCLRQSINQSICNDSTTCNNKCST